MSRAKRTSRPMVPALDELPERPSPSLRIREMQRRDTRAVRAISLEAFRQRGPRGRATRGDTPIAQVAVLRGDVVGYSVELRNRTRRRIELVGIAVDVLARGQGIGRALFLDVVAGARAMGARVILATVRETNLDGQLFLRSVGFEAIKVSRGHYRDTGEDAYRFAYRLPDRETLFHRFRRLAENPPRAC
jgi:ribosomal protein S18 acetylase RimI-like enzyme